MKNDYEIRGDITAIFLDRRNGDRLETLIDTKYLEMVLSLNYKWKIHDRTNTNNKYVFCRISRNPTKNIFLHRFIMNPPEGLVVDHINHDTLDNRYSNLRVITNAQNLQNLKGAYKNNSSSGVRGVHWHKRVKKWVASISSNGERKNIGCFDSIVEAEKAVKDARKKYMPFSVESYD